MVCFGAGDNLYYGIYHVPSGHKRANQHQSFQKSQIRYWGLHKVNYNLLNDIAKNKNIRN